MTRVKIIIFLAIFSLALVPLAFMQAQTTFTLNNAPASNIYPSTFDNLVYDLTITPSASNDTLKALTLHNTGSAGFLQISTLTLWSDNGPIGFQGLGIDNKISDFIFSSSYNNWYLTDLNVSIPAAGLRLFVSLETTRSASIIDNRLVQLQIIQLQDYDSDQTFDVGEAGIFLASGQNGPTNNLLNAFTQAILTATGDGAAPRVVITSPTDNSEQLSDFIISGQAKDQGDSTVVELQIKIGENAAWHEVENLSANYLNWQYQTAELAPGTYHVYTQAKDAVGNSTGTVYQLTIAVSQPISEPPTPPPAPKPEIKPIQPILYKSLDSPTVYLIDQVNLIRRPIFNAVIFEQHNYSWDDVELKSSQILASYRLSQPVLYTTGTLLKFYTTPYIYLVKNENQLEWIPNEQAFISADYRWSDVKELPDSYLAQYILLP